MCDVLTYANCSRTAPHSNMFARVNAPVVHVHWPTLLWCNQLAHSTIKSVQTMLNDLGLAPDSSVSGTEEHVDVRLEALMPKVGSLFLDE